MKKKDDQVVLLMTTQISQSLVETYKEIKNVIRGDVNVIYHSKILNEQPAWIVANKGYCFTDDILHELNFKPIQNTLIPGSNHFPLLKFYQENPAYDHYWLIEDDVRFSCNWNNFFTAVKSGSISESDFITCHIRRFRDEPLWYWWNTLSHPNIFIPPVLCLRSFNPIYRISNDALFALNRLLSDGWRGHHEVLMPTLLFLENFRISDFGGSGIFVEDGFENQIYIDSSPDLFGILKDGTMRFRPLISENEILIPNKLYHPVKDL